MIYNNAGNLILPMVMAIPGQEYVIYTSVYILVQDVYKRQVSVPAQGEEIAVHQLGVLFVQVFTPVGHGGRLLLCPSVYWSQGRDIRYRI